MTGAWKFCTGRGFICYRSLRSYIYDAPKNSPFLWPPSTPSPPPLKKKIYIYIYIYLLCKNNRIRKHVTSFCFFTSCTPENFKQNSLFHFEKCELRYFGISNDMGNIFTPKFNKHRKFFIHSRDFLKGNNGVRWWWK